MRVKINYMLLVIFIIQMALGTLIPTLSAYETSDYYYMFLTQIVAILIPSLAYIWFNKAGIKAIKRDKMIGFFDILIVCILSFAVNILINHFLCTPFYRLFQTSQSAAGTYYHTRFEFIIDVLIICIIPAMFEEILFRGITFAEYEKIYGTKKAMLLCAFVFSLMHGTYTALIPQFITGLFLTYIVFKMNSVYAGVIGHFIINLTTLLMQDAVSNTDSIVRFIISGNQLIIFIVLVVIAVVGIRLIGKMHITNKFKIPTLNQKEIQVEKNFFGLLIALYICIQLLRIL